MKSPESPSGLAAVVTPRPGASAGTVLAAFRPPLPAHRHDDGFRRELEAVEEKLARQLGSTARLLEACVQPLEQRVSAVEQQRPVAEWRFAGLEGSMNGLKEELEMQLRRGEAMEARLKQWRQILEDQIQVAALDLRREAEDRLRSAPPRGGQPGGAGRDPSSALAAAQAGKALGDRLDRLEALGDPRVFGGGSISPSETAVAELSGLMEAMRRRVDVHDERHQRHEERSVLLAEELRSSSRRVGASTVAEGGGLPQRVAGLEDAARGSTAEAAAMTAVVEGLTDRVAQLELVLASGFEDRLAALESHGDLLGGGQGFSSLQHIAEACDGGSGGEQLRTSELHGTVQHLAARVAQMDTGNEVHEVRGHLQEMKEKLTRMEVSHARPRVDEELRSQISEMKARVAQLEDSHDSESKADAHGHLQDLQERLEKLEAEKLLPPASSSPLPVFAAPPPVVFAAPPGAAFSSPAAEYMEASRRVQPQPPVPGAPAAPEAFDESIVETFRWELSNMWRALGELADLTGEAGGRGAKRILGSPLGAFGDASGNADASEFGEEPEAGGFGDHMAGIADLRKELKAEVQFSQHAAQQSEQAAQEAERRAGESAACGERCQRDVEDLAEQIRSVDQSLQSLRLEVKANLAGGSSTAAMAATAVFAAPPPVHRPKPEPVAEEVAPAAPTPLQTLQMSFAAVTTKATAQALRNFRANHAGDSPAADVTPVGMSPDASVSSLPPVASLAASDSEPTRFPGRGSGAEISEGDLADEQDVIGDGRCLGPDPWGSVSSIVYPGPHSTSPTPEDEGNDTPVALKDARSHQETLHIQAADSPDNTSIDAEILRVQALVMEKGLQLHQYELVSKHGHESSTWEDPVLSPSSVLEDRHAELGRLCERLSARERALIEWTRDEPEMVVPPSTQEGLAGS